MTVTWEAPAYDGGFPVTKHILYVDNTPLVELNPSLNWYQLTGLDLGTPYKLQVSVRNEIGESELSPSDTIVFANVPSEPTTIALTADAVLQTIEVEWTEPAQLNGDAIDGYKVYIDNGQGGPFSLVLDATGSPSTQKYVIGLEDQSLECGLLYIVRVTALNSAGEGSHASDSIYLGDPPSNPKNPRMVSVTPATSLDFAWDVPDSDGCLPILYYILNKDGVDLPTQISPSLTQYTDDITTGGQIGDQITYKIKAVNIAGSSPYCEELTITVGVVPSAPQSLEIVQTLSETSIQIKWLPGTAISSNPETLSYNVYLDDGSGNDPILWYDSATQAISTQVVLSGLVTGMTY